MALVQAADNYLLDPLLGFWSLPLVLVLGVVIIMKVLRLLLGRAILVAVIFYAVTGVALYFLVLRPFGTPKDSRANQRASLDAGPRVWVNFWAHLPGASEHECST